MSTTFDLKQKDWTTCAAARSTMASFVNPIHKKATQAMGQALLLDSGPAWMATSAIWQARLTSQNTASIAWAGLMATEAEFAALLAKELQMGVGMPLPPFGEVMEDARWWADIASPEERSAVAVACFNRFTANERNEFRAFISRA
jgi:hypothetical protein